MPSSVSPRRTAGRILLAAPNISGGDRAAMVDALAGTTIAYGPIVTAFEDAVAERLGVPYALAVTSGTSALHLALLAAGVLPGDEVLMPSLTYVAPANAVRYTGAQPVFLDSEPEYRQLDVARAAAFVERAYARDTGGRGWVSRATGARLAALLTVDLLGHPSDVDALGELTARLEIPLVDDAAEALGASIRGRPVGGVAPIAALSFNANKIMTTAGGGMLLTHDPAMAARARSLAFHSKEPGSALWEHAEVGFNYGMATAQAALGLAQLGRLDAFFARKREIAAFYADALGDAPGVRLPQEADWAEASYWLYTLDLPADRRAAVVAALSEADIESRPIFAPMHCVVAHAASQADDCHVAEALAATGLSLPCSTSITDDELADVAAVVRGVLTAEA